MCPGILPFLRRREAACLEAPVSPGHNLRRGLRGAYTLTPEGESSGSEPELLTGGSPDATTWICRQQARQWGC